MWLILITAPSISKGRLPRSSPISRTLAKADFISGNIVSFKIVNGDEDLMIITDSGIIIRLSIDQVSTTGRVAQGVRLIRLNDEQKVSNIAILDKDEEDRCIKLLEQEIEKVKN